MRLDLRVGTIAAATALCLPVIAYGQRPVVEGMSQRLTVACGTEGAKVQGMGNTVTLTGACATVLVEGSDNTVHIATLGRLTVAGMNNKVYWTSGIDGATPKITKEGVGNIVEKKTPADSGPATAKPQTTPSTTTPSSGGGTATATAIDADIIDDGDGQAGQSDAGGRRRWPCGRYGRGRWRSLGERDEERDGPGQAGVEHVGGGAGVGTPIVVPTNQQVKTMDCEGRAVSVQGNANRLTLRGRCGAGHRRRQREHHRGRLDDADRHVRQPQRREVPRAGRQQGAGRHLGRHRQPRLEGRTAVVLAAPPPRRGRARAKLGGLRARSSVG